MKTEMTYQTATPAEVTRVLAEAQALRSAYIAAFAARTATKVRGLFNRTPRQAAAA